MGILDVAPTDVTIELQGRRFAFGLKLRGSAELARKYGTMPKALTEFDRLTRVMTEYFTRSQAWTAARKALYEDREPTEEPPADPGPAPTLEADPVLIEVLADFLHAHLVQNNYGLDGRPLAEPPVPDVEALMNLLDYTKLPDVWLEVFKAMMISLRPSAPDSSKGEPTRQETAAIPA